MAGVKLIKAAKIYEDGYKAVKNIDLEINDEEFVVFVGPSGCGKSTTLRMIAGLESLSEGELYIGGELMNNVTPRDRNIAMVFQSYALYPHMTNRDNIAFALKLKGMGKEERYKKVDEAAKVLQLESELDKKPGQLSGGQRQRVALGRAMVRNPKVFLLDEPLSNLDAKLRVTMRGEIVSLHRKLKTTFIYVTHDQTEAMTMGDRIAVMNMGNVEQFDTPANLYRNPANIFVAQFIGSPQMNMLSGKLTGTEKEVIFRTGERDFILPEDITARLKVNPENQDVYLGIRPEDISFEKEDSKDWTYTVTAQNVEQIGSDTYVYFDIPQGMRQFCARFSPPRMIKHSSIINVRFDSGKVMLFDKASGMALLTPVSQYEDEE